VHRDHASLSVEHDPSTTLWHLVLIESTISFRNKKNQIVMATSIVNRSRRIFVKVLMDFGVLASLPFVSRPIAARPPEKTRPQADDLMVYAEGDRKGQLIQAADLQINAKPIAALPMEPVSSIIRAGSRLNKVMLVRLDTARLSSKTAKHGADGVLAYSSVCTHTGCDVNRWNDTTSRMVCSCHESEFEVADAARVVKGPAPKPLAMLPLKEVEGQLVVKSGFTRRVGFQQM
jgi:Rieske Fe-S protein|tara:strand:- start:314 stop:1009 length:696 start_codon:yes stop_codon:yes gene_type:complete